MTSTVEHVSDLDAPPKRSHHDHRPPGVRFGVLADRGEFEVSRLERTRTHSDGAMEILGVLAEELARLFGSNYPARAIELFLGADDSFERRCARWSALHTFEFLAGAKSRISPWPGWRPDNPDLRSRHLQPVELGLVRLLALQRPEVAATVGLCDAGVGSGELAGVLNGHVRLEDGEPVAVEIPDTEGARTVPIPAWCRKPIGLLYFDNQPKASLLYSGSATRPDKIQSCLLMRVNWALQRAGLGEPTPADGDRQPKLVKPISVRNGAGRECHDGGEGIETIAARWGLSNLTVTQRHLGLLAPVPRRTK